MKKLIGGEKKINLNALEILSINFMLYLLRQSDFLAVDIAF